MTAIEQSMNELTGLPVVKRLKSALIPILASKTAVIGLTIVLFWVSVALFAPLITRYGPLEQDYRAVNSGPSAKHLLGTDDMGRDLWARIAFGARVTLTLAPLSVLLAVVIGTTLGLVAGYFGGLVDETVMRVLDAMMAFPRILLYLVIIAALGPSAVNIVVAIMVAGVPGIARLVRSMTLDIRTRDYVAAAALRGEHPLYIMFVEILPNARGPIIVDAMLRVGYAIFSIGTMGFLGLGLAPPTPEWGNMVERGHTYIFTNPWAALWPALAISSLVVGLNLFADGLREETMRYQ
jgi:peptide/nickel transport system permease protein